MKIKKFLSVLLTVMLAVGVLAALPAAADVKDTSKDVSLTIYALEAADGSDVTVDAAVTGEQVTIVDRKPISGVSFNLYRVADTETSTTVPSGSTAVTTGYTGSDGSITVIIPAANQGRYLVVENEKPSNAEGTTVPFLVDLPMTNPQGTGFMYEVFVYPKQVVKEDSDTDSEPVSDTDSEPITDTDTDSEPITDTDTDTDSEPITDTDTDTDTPEPPPTPNVGKKVSDDNGKTWGDSAYIAAAEGQRAYWKVTAEIPDSIDKFTVYDVGDTLDNRLIAPEASEVKVSIDGKELPQSAYTVQVKGKTITVKFDAKFLVSYKNKFVDVIFPTAIDLTAPNSVGVTIQNVASLTFSRVADANDYNDSDTDSEPQNSDTDTDGTTTTTTTTTITSTTVEVLTGEIQGFKHDKENKPLAGAEFTLYSDKACKNAITKTVSDKDGNFYFRGILDGTYYLKETKAPNGYQANTDIIEVKVDLSKKEPVKVDVLNIPESNLPVTGGAGIIGLSIIGLSISVLGAFVIYLALVVRRRAKQFAAA